jgi:hypothetical protein
MVCSSITTTHADYSALFAVELKLIFIGSKDLGRMF